MKRFAVPIIAAAMALVLAGEASATPPPNGGTISIEPKTADGDYDSSMPAFVNGTTEALAARGFTILEDPGHSAYVAELILSRVAVGTGTARPSTDRAAALPGGAHGSVGAGVIIALPTGKSTLVPLLRTQLELRIRKRGDPAILWEGTALTVRAAGTRKGADEAVAAALGNALLQAYPAEPTAVVTVP